MLENFIEMPETYTKKSKNSEHVYSRVICKHCGKDFFSRKDYLQKHPQLMCACMDRRKFVPNDSYFDIPAYENSYIAGLLSADGSITRNIISFSSIDKHLINNVVNCLESKYKVYKSVQENGKDYYSIAINSKKLVGDLLKNYNIAPKKSCRETPPNLTGCTALCFIAGELDGDGTIYIHKHHNNVKGKDYEYFQPTANICGSKEICMWITEILKKETGLNYGSVHRIKGDLHIASIPTRQLVKFYSIIKDFDLPLLPRKWDKVKNFIDEKLKQ